jgi:hypothetical protein
MKVELVKGYSLVSEDGVYIRVEETPERERVILSLFRDGKTETASLNKEMFDALFDLKYKMEVHGKAEKEGAA